VGNRSVSLPRSSNRTCRFPASGFPTGFIAQPTAAARGARVEVATLAVRRRHALARTDSCRALALCAVCAGSVARGHPITRVALPTCRAHYPGGPNRGTRRWLACSCCLPQTCRWVGVRIGSFEACSGCTRVTARRIAQPPKAAFVTRLRPGQSPGRTARQLPDSSTIIRVEPPSTSNTRLRGALKVSP